MMYKMYLDCYPFKAVCLFIISVITLSSNCYGQSYGLGFSSFEVVQDKRTALDLSPQNTLCLNGNFDLSFELSFIPRQPIYFGYVLRVIESGGQNIDILYNEQNEKNPFGLIIGGNLTNIAFAIPRDKLFGNWNKLRIQFDENNNRILLYCNNRLFIQNGVHIRKDGCYKILFGTNSYKQFQTTDVPPMRLRNIKISENGVQKYSWPLNEDEGQVVHELLQQNNGLVTNPMWIGASHHDWQLRQSVKVKGPASVAFDSSKGILYVIGSDSLSSYNIKSSNWHSTAYPIAKLDLNIGNQSVFDSFDHSLYNVFPDTKLLAKYNFNTKSWDKKFTPHLITDYLHFNKFISRSDTSIYLFGGYGQLMYENEVQQYHLNTGQWNRVAIKGDAVMPRYLAALGSTKDGDTSYIIGGYGSASGKQILNPKNVYDLLRFTVKDKTFKKQFDLNVNSENFAFANSLVIDEKSKIYYGLIFPQHKYNSNLQMITGSLSKPNFSVIGNKIPYSFEDVNSFADLFYCPAVQQFVAVTMLMDKNQQTQINIFSLTAPPYDYISNEANHTQADNKWLIFGYFMAAAGSAAGLYFFLHRRRRNRKIAKFGNDLSTIPKFAPGVFEIKGNGNSNEEVKPKIVKERRKNAIYLFGDLQVFDAEGIDITKQFTPLIKELFLLILLNSIKWEKGLSSEKLNEILWSDKSIKDARNNRSVNITRLKILLDRLGKCPLSKDTGYWKMDIDYDHIYVDYHIYLDIIRNEQELDLEKIRQLTAIAQRGSFLSNIEYEWLDKFKSDVSNDIIDNFIHFIYSRNHSHSPELVIEIVNLIFYFDPVNEEAMIIKCKALSSLGKHSLAKNTFENFIKEYKNLYGEEFKKDFHTITE